MIKYNTPQSRGVPLFEAVTDPSNACRANNARWLKAQATRAYNNAVPQHLLRARATKPATLSARNQGIAARAQQNPDEGIVSA